MEINQDFKVIAEMPKGDKTSFRFTVSNFKGRRYFGTRLWFLDNEGKWLPTKKGFMLRDDEYEEFIGNMAKVGRALEDKTNLPE